MFADVTILFYPHSNIKALFKTVNEELNNEWFACNKLSLNIGQTKLTFFHKSSQNDNIPIVLPTLTINDTIIKRDNTTKFLLITDETLMKSLNVLNVYQINIIQNTLITHKSKNKLSNIQT